MKTNATILLISRERLGAIDDSHYVRHRSPLLRYFLASFNFKGRIRIRGCSICATFDPWPLVGYVHRLRRGTPVPHARSCEIASRGREGASQGREIREIADRRIRWDRLSASPHPPLPLSLMEAGTSLGEKKKNVKVRRGSRSSWFSS